MASRIVRRAWDVIMLGFDNHGGLYYYNLYTGLGTAPGPPVPYPPGLSPLPPFSIHIVMTSSAWPGGEHKINETVLVEGAPIVSEGHEAAHCVHIPPGINLLLPVTMYFASSKWQLGVGSVVAKKGPVASTFFGPIGANYNCQDPCAFPFPNVMVATASVHVQASGGDWLSSVLGMALQSIIEMVVSFVLEMPGVQKLMGKLLGPLSRRLSKLIEGAAAKTLGKGAIKDALEKLFAKDARSVVNEAARARAKALADAIAAGLDKKMAEELGQRAWEAAWKSGMKRLNDEFFGLLGKRINPGEKLLTGGIGDPIKSQATKLKDLVEDAR